MNEKSPMEKWEGTVSSTLTKANADQIWSLFIDFVNFHKWFPILSTCYGIHGNNGEVDGARYCAGFSHPKDDDGVDQVNWSTDRLVVVDPNEKTMSYEFVDSNIGFGSYSSTVKIVPHCAEGCVVKWSFLVDPVEGITYDYLLNMYQDTLDQTTKKMEDALVHNLV